MAFTPYSNPTNIIASLGTTPQERGLTTEEFKAKFDQFATEFVEWFNATHLTESAHKGSPAPQEYNLINGFVADGAQNTNAYYKDQFGFVYCFFSLKKSGTSDDITTAGAFFTNLPEGYRPPSTFETSCKIKTNSGTIGVGRVAVYFDGNMAIYPAINCVSFAGQIIFNTNNG